MAKKSEKQKKAKHAAAAPPAGAAAPARPALTVRHYCQGIGDCHLLSFPKADGTRVQDADRLRHSSLGQGRPGHRR